MNELIPTTPQPLNFLTEIERDPHLKSDHTRRQYRAALSAFETWRNGRILSLTLVEEYASELQKRDLSPNTINQALAVIRWWARRVVKLADELTDREQAERISRLAEKVIAVETVKGSRGTRGRHLENHELAALIDACTADPSPIGARDAALISVAIATGCRNEELRTLTMEDFSYTKDGADLIIRHGKGDKSRTVYLYNGSLAAVDAWLNFRGIKPGFLFNPIQKGGEIHLDRTISYEGTRKILHNRFLQSTLPQTLTWHDFRRTLAGILFDNGVDPSVIQDQFGHASYNTTKRYDRRPESRRREALQAVEVPYKKE